MATRLAGGLATVPGVELLQPVQANELFVAVPEALIAALERERIGAGICGSIFVYCDPIFESNIVTGFIETLKRVVDSSFSRLP